jgi:hypothetical protein
MTVFPVTVIAAGSTPEASRFVRAIEVGAR